MERFYTEKRRLRKSTPISGYEVTMPPAWIKNLKASGNLTESIELLYGPVVVLVPKGVKVDTRKLAAAILEG